MTPAHIIHFWFTEAAPKQWWTSTAEFDQLIRSRFGAIHAQAARCELAGWRVTPPGRLAEIIVLDQFSRNIDRGTPLAFANDALALALAQEALAAGVPAHLTPEQKVFLYTPFLHSESPAIHAGAAALFQEEGQAAKSAAQHRAIVDRFGRYPHRNATLGRTSTDEEIEFLKRPGSSF
ncbi:uncharacterized protein (DUF924 family) [Actimicrobium sp. GrIS 1.19]|uniref:DUF924 family protein n=1 Tax=Actimicrobium sp. GrIS 1.19 TaxID=3071708 RepID=UPI002E018A7E|nr:uncharacterized protein (DUF924 family) [Actimicrobium sp. GrIS 1.19]